MSSEEGNRVQVTPLPVHGRRLLAEFLGTFVIVFAPVAVAGSGKLDGGDPSLLAAALVSGLAVLAMIFAVGPISAAHLNPAVTLAFALVKRFPWRMAAPYAACQLMGGAAAALTGWLIFGFSSGAHIPSEPSLIVRNLGMEVALTFILMLVIMGVATDKRVPMPVPGMAVGLTVVAAVLIGGPVTGGSMNPARSLGPALLSPEALGHVWLYFVGPSAGAALGALSYELLRTEPEHAKSAPDSW